MLQAPITDALLLLLLMLPPASYLMASLRVTSRSKHIRVSSHTGAVQKVTITTAFIMLARQS